MPRIRFIQVTCAHCGAVYKVRLERIERREPFECLTCGTPVQVEPFIGMLEAVYRYSEAALKVENHGTVEGEVLVPPSGVTVGPSPYK